MRQILRTAIAFAGLIAAATSADAQSVAAFYKGKTLTFVTGSGGSGSYDLAARVVSQYIPRYLPGHPTAIVQSMPGASHARATEYIDNVARRDGTILGFVQPYVVLNKILHPKVSYSPDKLTWIIRLRPLVQLGFAWHTSGIVSIEQAKRKSIDFGAQGATGPAATVPWALNRMIGTKFHVVRGYPSDAATVVAMQRGEVQGLGSAQYDFLVHQPEYLQKHWVVPLYVIGLQRIEAFPDVPTIVDLAPNDGDREIMRILAIMPAIGLTIIAPPDVPQDRVDALRAATAKIVADPGFKADMAKIDMDIDPLSGPEVAKLVSQSMQATPEQARELRDYTSPQD